MVYSSQFLYFSSLVLTCMSSESVPPMSGFYTDDLDQTLSKIEIVYPEKVSKDGSFVSYYLPHYYNLESFEIRPRRTVYGFEDTKSDDAIHFFVPIEGEKHQLELWPNLNFLAPGLVIERRDARDVDNINKAKISQISQKQCHYNGRIVGMPDSRAALSTCYGLAGYIQLPAGEEYLIEPVKDSKPAFNKEHPHVMYKRSGMKDRHGSSNCLTKGTAKEALAERLQWESVFGGQVREDFSAINMNDLVRESTAKRPQDSLRIMKPIMDSQPAVAIPQEISVKDGEIKLNKEKSNSINIPQSSYLKNENVFEGNVPPSNPYQYEFSPFEKQGQLKSEYGNKLKQKALREELGSIKLPDANVSPPNQQIDTEHFINKPIASHHERDKKIYEPDVEFSRVKRELNQKNQNLNPDSNRDFDIRSNEVYQQVPSKNYLKEKQNSEEAKVNSFGEINNHYTSQCFEKPNAKGAEFEINIKSKETAKLKRDTQNSKDTFLTERKIAENSNGKINKDNVISKRDNEKEVKNEVITSLINNINNADINSDNTKDVKQNDLLNSPINEQMLNTDLENNLNQKYSSTNIENNLKRDIHLDTSEKSWQSEKNHKNVNTCSKSDEINQKETHSADIKGQFVDDTSQINNNLPNILESDKKKESKLSKISKVQKSNTDNDDKIMVSALESVVRDMDKTKVKKDVLGGFAHPESKNLKIQPLYAKPPVNYNDETYIKQGQTPEQSPIEVDGRDENPRTFESSSKIGPGIVKESMQASDVINEPIQSPKAYSEKQSQNHVDEIIIRIKTPEGTISEVKQNHDTEGLRNNNIESVMINGNTGTKDSVFGKDQLKSSFNIKTKDVEKSKRGVDSKSEKEGEEKFKNQDVLKNGGGYSAQDSIIVEAPQQFKEEIKGPTKNKAKRDDNTIHLVIETEPEVKSPEGRNSESPGSNLFCQGKNCLEIKPVFLNDTKAALTSTNNTNGESNKEKVVEKRDAEGDETCDIKTTETPLRCQDFYNKVFNIELMITVDYKVVKMHEDDDIENFILTIINMVSSNFDDKSIGLNLNVVLVRLILLTTCIKELDSDRFEPEELLENFCTWQVLVNPGRDDHPHHHDLAIFVSKMDTCAGKVMGVSYMTSVCRPDKACIICVDEGLLLANTITHQIGHSLGADHDDGQSSGCAPKLPDGSTYHMSPTITETSSAWSVCSKDAIIQFVQTQGSWCLIDTPIIRSYNFPLILPGQIYSAAQQCKLNFHMTAIPCLVGQFCNKLYCQITDKLCATKGDPPADGTFCASNMWCFHKQCVHIGRRPGAINGEWGPWTEWSVCTRSCGGGVSNSYRICNNPKPENGGRFCVGDRMRFRMCQTAPCQGFTESFRDLQCKRTEDRPFRGKVHNWVQYQSLFINIECALVCQNRKGEVVMRSPIVADGTPCKAGTQNVCIQGICRTVGCDYVIDSNAKDDACGVCHGNGTECRIIQGVFDEAITKKGLIEFLRIPKDSGMIFVREIAPSGNIIVVSGAINRAFYLNGLEEQDLSTTGDVSFGLTHGVYEKRGGMERIFIRGPTKEDLIFYVYFREINKGIHYQYATLEYDPTYIPRYQWQHLDWDACTDPCSGGSQRSRAKCVEDRGGVVDDKYCLESLRPIDIIRPCNDFPCQAKWWVSVWSDCICTGTTSVMFRSVLCMRANDESGTRVEVVKESECTVSKKPPTQKPCNYSEEDNECAKRSIPDNYLFHQHRDLRRAVSPESGYSALSPVDSEGSVSEETQSLSEQSFDDFNKESLNENKNIKKLSKPQSNKNVNVKGSVSKFTKPKVVVKDQLDKKKLSTEKLQEIEHLKPIELSKNEGSDEHKPYMKNEDMLLEQNKGRQTAELTQKNSGSLAGPLKSAISKLTGDNTNDIDAKCGEEKGAGDNCDTSIQTSPECQSKDETTEKPETTTCKQTCAIEPHKKTTCCRTTPHRQYEHKMIKTTFETTTIRPIAVKLDELNMNDFGLTVVPLDVPGKRKLFPQSDPEFINLGSLGQFGVGDELNATVLAGQEALDLLEFAKSNASEEPDILHEDNMHN